ncbi:TPA: hypothetical protein ACHVJE_001846 [Streptococcus suis]|nr:hypothetical protein [Streptococcus suis]
MKQILNKILILFLSLILVLPTLITTSYAVHANEIYNQSTLTPEEQELADALQFMFDNAVVYDSNGFVKDIKFDIIYSKYGHSTELEQVEKNIKYEKRLRAGDLKQCAIIAIQDTLGVSVINGLLAGGIVGLLQRKAAAEITKLVAKYTFKNLVPAAAAASLIWSFGRCMWF